jgi:hypothetical protein
MANEKKGKAKRAKARMANPKISASAEKRHRGPWGLYKSYKEALSLEKEAKILFSKGMAEKSLVEACVALRKQQQNALAHKQSNRLCKWMY